MLSYLCARHPAHPQDSALMATLLDATRDARLGVDDPVSIDVEGPDRGIYRVILADAGELAVVRSVLTHLGLTFHESGRADLRSAA